MAFACAAPVSVSSPFRLYILTHSLNSDRRADSIGPILLTTHDCGLIVSLSTSENTQISASHKSDLSARDTLYPTDRPSTNTTEEVRPIATCSPNSNVAETHTLALRQVTRRDPCCSKVLQDFTLRYGGKYVNHSSALNDIYRSSPRQLQSCQETQSCTLVMCAMSQSQT